MKKLSWILGGAFLIFSLIFIAPTSAYACTCAPPPSPHEAVEGAEAVFIGKVIQISEWSKPTEDSEDVSGFKRLTKEVLFEVGLSWKGASEEDIVIYSALNESSCGTRFKEGRRYLVYAYEYEGELHTNKCFRTTRFPEAIIDIVLLEKGKTLLLLLVFFTILYFYKRYRDRGKNYI
jgi:hypothetical protein